MSLKRKQPECDPDEVGAEQTAAQEEMDFDITPFLDPPPRRVTRSASGTGSKEKDTPSISPCQEKTKSKPKQTTRKKMPPVSSKSTSTSKISEPSSSSSSSSASSTGQHQHIIDQAVYTCVPVQKLPALIDRLEQELQDSEQSENATYDWFHIQTLLLEAAMDATSEISTIPNEHDRLERLYRNLKECVLSGDEFKLTKRSQDTSFPQNSALGNDHDMAVVESYNEFMESNEQSQKRSYRFDSPQMPQWDEQDWAVFKEAYSKFPDAPSSNRKIAEYMNRNKQPNSALVHPNHVLFYKRVYKRQLAANDKS